MKPLFSAERAVFLLGMEGVAPFYSEEYPASVVDAYVRHYHTVDTGLDQVRQLGLSSPVLNQTLIVRGRWSEYRRDAFVNEWAWPNGFYDVAGVVLDADDASFPRASRRFRQGSRDIRAYLSVQKDAYGTEPFGDWGLAVFGLIKPALLAGLYAYDGFCAHRATLLRTLDESGIPSLLCDGSGGVLHQSTALASLLQADPERESILKQMHAVARALASSRSLSLKRDECTLASPAFQHVRTALSDYRISGSYVAADHPTADSYILVRLERALPDWPSGDSLRERFGLTRQEARIALLLARRHTNAEIAELLYISPYTARHHTERVLSKLGVASRTEVAAALLRSGA